MMITFVHFMKHVFNNTHISTQAHTHICTNLTHIFAVRNFYEKQELAWNCSLSNLFKTAALTSCSTFTSALYWVTGKNPLSVAKGISTFINAFISLETNTKLCKKNYFQRALRRVINQLILFSNIKNTPF